MFLKWGFLMEVKIQSTFPLHSAGLRLTIVLKGSTMIGLDFLSYLTYVTDIKYVFLEDYRTRLAHSYQL